MYSYIGEDLLTYVFNRSVQIYVCQIPTIVKSKVADRGDTCGDLYARSEFLTSVESEASDRFES